uniref:G_PROTEIN_RECEP_F1_2 domain-containing protein n=1 Tax=Parastrongyloides trichosuri TaxID=131310 RepID=A0A0N4ZPD5_PARTI
MTITGTVLLREILSNSATYKNEFYLLVCYKTFNDIISLLSVIFLIKLPQWGILSNLYLNNNFLSSLSYFFGSSTGATTILHTFFVSFIRFCALNYPIKYRMFFDSSKKKFLIIFMLIFCICIGTPSLFFQACYVYVNLTNTVTPIIDTESASFYQFFYVVVLYGIIISITFGLNISNSISYCKNTLNTINKKKNEISFFFYSFFTFATAFCMETYLMIRIFGVFTGNETLICLANKLLAWIGDISTLFDFYFFIYISPEIRITLKKTFKRKENKVTPNKLINKITVHNKNPTQIL